MGPNELLTVLALLIAGYSLLSEEKRLDIILRFSWPKRIFVGLFLLVILFVIYSPVILSIFDIKSIPWLWGFHKDIMIFSCLIVIIAFFVFIVSGHQLPSSRYKNWADASKQYLHNKKFEQLGYLFNKYHQQLFKEITNQTKEANTQINVRWLKIFLAKFLSKQNKKQEIARSSISRILKSSAFVAYLAESYPLVGAKATCLPLPLSEFTNSFFRSLMSCPGSALYRELRDNQGSSYTGEYTIDESNPLLSFYLKDISVAIGILIWKPIGDYVIDFIHKQRGQDNYYNQPDNNYPYSDERWESPIFVGIFFFEVMVSRAIFQRSKDHMWLSYYEKFLGEILESLEYPINIDMKTEFPTRFDYLIFELFSGCGSWVSSVNHLDYNDWSDEDIKRSPEYWAAKTLGNMLYKIIMSDKLSDSQKVYLLESVIKRMDDLDEAGKDRYSRLIFTCCTYPFDNRENEAVKELSRLYEIVDHALKSHNSTFSIKLNDSILSIF